MKKFLLIITVFIFAACTKDNSTGSDSNTSGNQTPFYLAIPYNITSSSVVLSWTEYSGTDFKEYIVMSSFDTTFANLVSAETLLVKKTTTKTLADLISDTTYFFRVRLIKSNKTKVETQVQSAITSTEPKIVLGTPYNETYHSVELSWSEYGNSKNDFKEYQVYRSTASGFNPDPDSAVKKITDPKRTSYVIDELASNSEYFFKVRLLKKNGQYYDSDERRGLTWVLLFHRFEGDFGSADTVVPTDSTVVNEGDGEDSLSISGYFDFSAINLLHFKEVLIEYTVKTKSALYPAATQWSINIGTYYLPPDSIFDINSTRTVDYKIPLHDYQFLTDGTGAVSLSVDFGYGAISPANFMMLYGAKISAVRMDGHPYPKSEIKSLHLAQKTHHKIV